MRATIEFKSLVLSLLCCATLVDGFSPVVVPSSRVAGTCITTGVGAYTNGDSSTPIVDNVDDVEAESLMSMAPALTFDKFVTLQDKRVVVAIQYSGESGLKPYYLTVAKKIKETHPDVIIEKKILPVANEGGESTFEIVVDGKVVLGKNNARIQRLGSDKVIQDSTGGMSVFVSMMELDVAITKARKRRRPQTSYGQDDETTSREMRRGGDTTADSDSWND